MKSTIPTGLRRTSKHYPFVPLNVVNSSRGAINVELKKTRLGEGDKAHLTQFISYELCQSCGQANSSTNLMRRCSGISCQMRPACNFDDLHHFLPKFFFIVEDSFMPLLHKAHRTTSNDRFHKIWYLLLRRPFPQAKILLDKIIWKHCAAAIKERTWHQMEQDKEQCKRRWSTVLTLLYVLLSWYPTIDTSKLMS